VAAAAAAVSNGWSESPVDVHLAGGDLLVELAGGTARLVGAAQEICHVELSEEFQL
jgi:diaminopimelate epimerase